MPQTVHDLFGQSKPALYPQVTSQNPCTRVRPRRGAQPMVVPLASVSNAGMARVQGFPAGESPGGHLLRCTLLQWNNHCGEEHALHMITGRLAVARLVGKGQG